MSSDSSQLAVGQRLELQIDKLASGGRGVARHHGRVIFVDGAAPDELVAAEITAVKKNYAEARVQGLLRPSIHRVQPLCPVFGKCGGCSWQHIDYAEQLRQKRNLVEEALQKFFRVHEVAVAPVIPSPQPWYYRNRIQLHARGQRIGFHARGSNELVEIQECRIAEPGLNQELQRLRGQKNLPERFELPWQVGSGAEFHQVNTQVNLLMIDHVVAQARAACSARVQKILDLYCGSGNFTFALAAAFSGAEVHGVELNARSVQRARERVTAAGPQFHAIPAETFLASQSTSSTLVVLDPPRQGCSTEVLRALLRHPAQALIYVSCDPVTLARDLKSFGEAGFRLTNVQPFDMFPQTEHVETVATLVLTKV